MPPRSSSQLCQIELYRSDFFSATDCLATADYCLKLPGGTSREWRVTAGSSAGGLDRERRDHPTASSGREGRPLCDVAPRPCPAREQPRADLDVPEAVHGPAARLLSLRAEVVSRLDPALGHRLARREHPDSRAFGERL